jgi:hypothetical protein
MSYLLDYSRWKRVFEQQATQSQITPLVLDWWNKNKDKPLTKRSLAYWNGASGEVKGSPSAKQENVIANLKQIISLPGPGKGAQGTPDADPLNKIVVALENLSKGGVYIQDFSDTKYGRKPGPGAYLNSLTRADSGLKVWQNTGLDAAKKLMIQNVDQVVTSINSPDYGGKASFTPLTDEVKNQLMAEIEARTQRRVQAFTNRGKKGYTLEKAIEEAQSIWIAPDKEAGTIQKTEAQGKVTDGAPVTYNYSYPSKENKFDTKMNNFFDDDKYEVSEKDKGEYDKMVKENLDAIIQDGGKITNIVYSAGASTSKVGTRYAGKGKLGDKWSPENNKILVQDRISSINAVLEELLQPYASSAGIELTKQEDESAPNIGLGWKEYSKVGEYEYGPLYEAARKNKSSLTPNEFYTLAKRKSDSAIKEEYDEVFGKFRGNYGEFSVVATFEVGEDEPGKDAELIGAGAWKAKIEWPRKPQKAPKPKTVSGGGGKSYVGVKLEKAACFAF